MRKPRPEGTCSRTVGSVSSWRSQGVDARAEGVDLKIVVLGAGSAKFGRGQIADALQAPELKGRGVTLSLVDTDEVALERMRAVAERIKGHTGTDVSIEATVDRRSALPGADYVIVAVARNRMELWEQDFRIPLSHGFRHCLGENGGPGALFHALRSFHLIMPICRDVEELCPDAWLLNFTNPEARVLHAICHLTRVKAAGICHGFFSAQRAIAGYLDASTEELDITSAGMNHFYCVLSVRRKGSEEELLPLAKRLALADPEAEPLFKKLIEVYDVFSFVSDDHTGEYLSFGSEFQGTKWRYGRESAAVGGTQAGESALLDQYAREERPADDPAILAESGEITVPVICDLELDRKRSRPAVNVLNTEAYIENLPRDVVVEVPAMVDARGIHPRHVGSLPEAFAAHMQPQYSIHRLLTEAYRTRSRRLLLQALLLDPVVDSITAAEKLLDEMLEIQKDYLPEFAAS